MARNENDKLPTVDDLNEMLQPEQRQETQSNLDVLKELFNLDSIESKTELTIEQVILINQKRTISKLLQWGSLNDCLNDFMFLMISKNRKGRGEFVDGFKSDRETEVNKQGGFFGGIKERLNLK